jgi:hypothetical protein
VTYAVENIPANLREAFQDAMVAFHDWDRGGPEPKRFVGSSYLKISAVCNLVWSFTDTMPDDDYDKLCRLASNIRRGQMTEAFWENPPAMPESRSYASGAKCLKSLIDCRDAWYKRPR